MSARIAVVGKGYPFGADLASREMMRTIMSSTSAIYWHSHGGPVLHSGSAFFVRTEKAIFGVTARHVYEGYLASTASEPMVCQVGGLVIRLEERLIAVGIDVDIATFRVTPAELANLGNTTAPWPPQVPVEGAGVFVCGLPGFARDMPRAKTVTFKHFVALMCVDSVSDRGISMVRQPDEEMIDVFGRELPPPNMDIGGMSGGLIAVHMNTPMGLTCWFTSAVISEGHQSYDIIHGSRADWINDDGTIHG
jgi:hypothetical protein